MEGPPVPIAAPHRSMRRLLWQTLVLLAVAIVVLLAIGAPWQAAAWGVIFGGGVAVGVRFTPA